MYYDVHLLELKLLCTHHFTCHLWLSRLQTESFIHSLIVFPDFFVLIIITSYGITILLAMHYSCFDPPQLHAKSHRAEMIPGQQEQYMLWHMHCSPSRHYPSL